jgi:hypothetical protein
MKPAFLSLRWEDLREIYEAENPLATALRKILAAESSAEGRGIAGNREAWERRGMRH